MLMRDWENCDFKLTGVNLPTIDVHIHHGPLPASMYSPRYDVSSLLSLLDHFNVKLAFCTHCLQFASPTLGFEELKKLMRETNYRVLGYLVYDPNLPEPSQAHIEQDISEKGIIGVKVHPAMHTCSISDRRYDWLWDFCSRNGVRVLCHTWSPDTKNPKQKYADPLMFEDVLRRFPDLTVILAHAGGKPPHMLKVIELLKRFENLYVDFAGDTFFPGIIEAFVEKLGPERILFGSDFPMIDPRMHVGRFVFSRLSEKELRDIFFSNACRIFGLNQEGYTCENEQSID